MNYSHFLDNWQSKRKQKIEILAEIEQWTPAEQTVFLHDAIKLLSINLIKFINSICNDLIEKKNNLSTNNIQTTTNNNSNKSGSNNNSNKNNTYFSSILEEQANDLIYFQVLNEKPTETKLKMILSYLPLLKNQEFLNYDINFKLKNAYNQLILDVFKDCFKNNCYLLECYELALLSSLHPIFDASQHDLFKTWINIFLNSIVKLNETICSSLETMSKTQSKQQLHQETNLNDLNSKNDQTNNMDLFWQREKFSNKVQVESFNNANLNTVSIHLNDQLNNFLDEQQSSFVTSGTNVTEKQINSEANLADSNQNSLSVNQLAQSNLTNNRINSLSNVNISLSSPILSSTSSSSSSSSTIQMNLINQNENNINDDNKTSDIDFQATLISQSKIPLFRQHMPLKMSSSLPPNRVHEPISRTNFDPKATNLMNLLENNFSSLCVKSSNNLNVPNSALSVSNENNFSGFTNFEFLNLDNLITSSQSPLTAENLNKNLFNNKNNQVNSEKSKKLSLDYTAISENSTKPNNEVEIKNIALWLKHLRLHKYTNHFLTISYDELLELNDEMLINLNITLGARKKLISNIEKLKARPERLKQLINNLNEQNYLTNELTIEKILIELTEMAMTPMKQQNFPPTSIASIANSKSLNELNNNSSNNKTESLSQLLILLLEKIQKFFLNQKSNLNENLDLTENEREQRSLHLKELILIYMKIIDKLFLTRAFSDIQNSQLAMLRSSLCEKNSNTKSDSPVKKWEEYPDQQDIQKQRILKQYRNANDSYVKSSDRNPNFLKPMYSLKLNMSQTTNQHQNYSLKPPQATIRKNNKFNNEFESFDSENDSTNSKGSNLNSIYARQRIEKKSFKRDLEKTCSAPFYRTNVNQNEKEIDERQHKTKENLSDNDDSWFNKN